MSPDTYGEPYRRSSPEVLREGSLVSSGASGGPRRRPSHGGLQQGSLESSDTSGGPCRRPSGEGLQQGSLVSSGITPGETGDASSSLKIRHPLAKWIRSDSTIGLGIREDMHSIPTSRVIRFQLAGSRCQRGYHCKNAHVKPSSLSKVEKDRITRTRVERVEVIRKRRISSRNAGIDAPGGPRRRLSSGCLQQVSPASFDTPGGPCHRSPP